MVNFSTVLSKAERLARYRNSVTDSVANTTKFLTNK